MLLADELVSRTHLGFGEDEMLDSNNTVDRLMLKGTTTVGVVCKDGVVLASDTRVTMGSYVAHKKG